MIDRFGGEYSFLSNFYFSPLFLEGKVWPTVEHYFQAAKAIPGAKTEILKDFELVEVLWSDLIRASKTPGEAKRIGREVPLRPGWDDMRLSVMEDGLREKFKSGSDLAVKLLSTENEELVEGNYWGDTFWGVCRGEGQNNLGKLLMKIRKEL